VIDFELDVTPLIRLAEAMPAMKEDIDAELEAAMGESGQLLTTMVAARTPVNFGILRSSIQWPAGFEVRGTPSGARGLEGLVRASPVQMAGTSPHEYANYVEFGRRPGKWPPVGPIQLWVIRKLSPPADELDSIVFLVRRKIGTKGTEPKKMFHRAWAEGGKTRVQRIFDQVPQKAVKRFAMRRA